MNLNYRIAYYLNMTDLDFRVGATIEVLTTDGPRTVKLLDLKGNTLFVCAEEELSSAQIEERLPQLRGFNKQYVLRILAQPE